MTSPPYGVRRRVIGGALATAVACSLAVATAPSVAATPEPALDPGNFQLTILHNNDGESQLIGAPADPNYGGVARFATVVDDLRREARGSSSEGEVMLSSGDNFLAGPQFQASLDKGPPYYDSIAMRLIGYDASAIGNHEFDFGPDVLAAFIAGFGGQTPFVSANLDVRNEPSLDRLADMDIIVGSTVTETVGQRIGIVGATTPELRSISSPRDVIVRQRVRQIVQAEVIRLTSQGVNKIILISHLQGIGEDKELMRGLRGVDVVIAGGGSELLANEGDLLVPGDERTIDPDTGEPYAYPVVVRDRGNKPIPLVTTNGDYKYVGRLVVDFDADGIVTGVGEESGPVRVSGVAPDAVQPDPEIQSRVVDPVAAYVEDLDQEVIAQSEVPLDGTRDNVRTEETNLGNLIADALLYTGQQEADSFGVVPPQIALQNGGGIRNNSVIPAGPITALDTFNIAPFSNFVSVVPDIPPSQVKELLENAVSNVENVDGRFAQVAGLSFTYTLDGTPQVTEDDGTITVPGTRVLDVVLDDGQVVVQDGVVVDGPSIAIATNDFSARGGDQYPFRGAPFTTVGKTYQQALAEYIVEPEGLDRLITAAEYPVGGEGRITAV